MVVKMAGKDVKMVGKMAGKMFGNLYLSLHLFHHHLQCPPVEQMGLAEPSDVTARGYEEHLTRLLEQVQ